MVITKNRITSKILFRLTQNFSYIRSSLCSRHLQSFKSLPQNSLFHWCSKMCSKWAPRRCRHIWIRRAKFSMTLPHSSLGIAFIAAVIAAFRSGIVWGLLPYTLSSRYPTYENLGVSSPVNAATTAGRTCGWSVGQGNATVAMPMIRLRCGGWHHPAGTTGGLWQRSPSTKCCPELTKHLDSGHIAQCWLSQTARCCPLGCGQQSFWQQQRCVVSLMISVIQNVIVCLVSLQLRLCTVPWVLNLLTHL